MCSEAQHYCERIRYIQWSNMMEQNDVSFIHGVKFNELYPFEATISEKYEFLGIELNTQRIHPIIKSIAIYFLCT